MYFMQRTHKNIKELTYFIKIKNMLTSASAACGSVCMQVQSFFSEIRALALTILMSIS
jgi:hypothetical protein